MKQLSRDAFGRARQFLMTQARPLERALFMHHFEGASVENVLVELTSFQNQDGGFGRALEPDLRTPSTSALATGIGLRMLKELRCPSEHPMVRKAVEYLLVTYDDVTRVWHVAPPDTNSNPHAPWWHDEDGSLEQRFDGFRIIPRALIVSSLHHFSKLVPLKWLNDLTEETIRYIDEFESLGGGGGSALEYAINLAETKGLAGNHAERLKIRIKNTIPTAVVRDPEMWDSYCTTPLRVVPSPQSYGADLIQEELQKHLDYQIEHQTPEGTWIPTWSWGNSYPEAWVQAKLEWSGHLTLEALTQLRAFGRIGQ